MENILKFKLTILCLYLSIFLLGIKSTSREMGMFDKQKFYEPFLVERENTFD